MEKRRKGNKMFIKCLDVWKMVENIRQMADQTQQLTD